MIPIKITGEFSVNENQIKDIKAVDKCVNIYVQNKKDAFLSLQFEDEVKARNNAEGIRKYLKFEGKAKK